MSAGSITAGRLPSRSGRGRMHPALLGLAALITVGLVGLIGGGGSRTLLVAALVAASLRPDICLWLLLLSFQLPPDAPALALISIGPADLFLSDGLEVIAVVHLVVIVVREKKIARSLYSAALLGFLIWCFGAQVFAALFLDPVEYGRSLVAFARMTSYMVLPWLSANLIRSRRQVIAFAGALVLLPLVHLGWSAGTYAWPVELSEGLHGAVFPEKFVNYFPITGFHALGLFGAPYPLANSANVALALTLSGAAIVGKRLRLPLMVVASLLLITLLFTKVRTEWIICVVAVLMLLWGLRARTRLLTPILVFVLAGALVAGPIVVTRVAQEFRGLDEIAAGATGLGSRIEVWKDAFELVASSPLLGVGAAGIERLGGTGAPTGHSLYVEVAVNFGLISLGLLICLLVWMAREGLHAARDPDPLPRWLGTSLFALVAGLAVGSVTGVILLVGSANHLLLLAGLTTAARRVRRRDAIPGPDPGAPGG